VGAEQCDDGNTVDTDGCERCYLATCGNGTIEGDERCDDNNTIPGDGCSADCASTCGNGTQEPWETCDDGNIIDNDGCPSTCTPACGDGAVAAGEQCDDGNNIDTDFCLSTCQNPCGFYDYGQLAMIAGTTGACYAVMPDAASYSDAAQACATLPGTALLAIPDDNGDLSVAGVIAAAYGPLWLGANDVDAEGTFVWPDATPINTTSWAPTQPDDPGGLENCISIDATGQWFDDDCASTLPFVCSILAE